MTGNANAPETSTTPRIAGPHTISSATPEPTSTHRRQPPCPARPPDDDPHLVPTPGGPCAPIPSTLSARWSMTS